MCVLVILVCHFGREALRSQVSEDAVGGGWVGGRVAGQREQVVEELRLILPVTVRV